MAIVRNKYLINNLKGWKPVATLPEGALFAGGIGYGDYTYFIGGTAQLGGTGLARRYNAITNVWTVLPNAPLNLVRNTCAVVNNKLYSLVINGMGGVAIYDIATNTWSQKTLTGLENAPYASVSVGTDIYLAGGLTDPKTFQVYNTNTNTLTSKPSMPNNHPYAAIALYNGKIYVIGGGAGIFNVDVYDVAGETWTSGSPAPIAVNRGAFGLIGDNLYLAGGVDNSTGQPTNVVLCYNITSDSWSTKKPLPATVYACASGVVGDYLYVMSGYQNNVISNNCFKYKG